jgi:hypothetical protein
MKKIFLQIFLVLVYFSVSAQRDSIRSGRQYLKNAYFPGNKKFSLEVNIGAGIPMEDYGNISQTPFSTTDTTHLNGLASLGFHFNCTASYLFSQFFGGTIMLGETLNNFNKEKWQTLRNNAVPGITTSVNGSFYIGQYLIGPYASLPVSNKVQIEFKALLGLITATYPTITQTYPASYSVNFPTYIYGIPVTQEKAIEKSTNFGYYFGTGIMYIASNHIGINLNIGYAGSDIGYPKVTVTFSQSGYLTSSYTEYSTYTHFMQLGIFQAAAGISYNW